MARPCPLRAAGICSSARHPMPAVLLRLWDSVWHVVVWLYVSRAMPWGGTDDGRASSKQEHKQGTLRHWCQGTDAQPAMCTVAVVCSGLPVHGCERQGGWWQSGQPWHRQAAELRAGLVLKSEACSGTHSSQGDGSDENKQDWDPW